MWVSFTFCYNSNDTHKKQQLTIPSIATQKIQKYWESASFAEMAILELETRKKASQLFLN